MPFFTGAPLFARASVTLCAHSACAACARRRAARALCFDSFYDKECYPYLLFELRARLCGS